MFVIGFSKIRLFLKTPCDFRFYEPSFRLADLNMTFIKAPERDCKGKMKVKT